MVKNLDLPLNAKKRAKLESKNRIRVILELKGEKGNAFL